MPTTANMSLVLPIVSTTIGPLWAAELNNALTLVDAHDHSPGKGVQIPSNGIALNADLPFNSFNATFLRSSRYVNNVSPLALPSDLSSVYVSGGNLYYNNSIGQQIQITAGAALNATSIGGIGGDYGTSTASVFYTSATQTFTFWQDVNTPALLDVGPIILRPPTLSPFGITFQAPTGISADYTITLPLAAPASTKFLTMDSSGNIAAVRDVDNVTIEVNGNDLRVKPGSIGATQLSSGLFQPIQAIFTADGTFTVPAGVTSVFITGYGAGGGGGGGGGGSPGSGGQHNGGGGGGGAAAGSSRTITVSSSPGDMYTVIIGLQGAGGAGGAANGFSGTGGTAGGPTIVVFPSGQQVVFGGGAAGNGGTGGLNGGASAGPGGNSGYNADNLFSAGGGAQSANGVAGQNTGGGGGGGGRLGIAPGGGGGDGGFAGGTPGLSFGVNGGGGGGGTGGMSGVGIGGSGGTGGSGATNTAGGNGNAPTGFASGGAGGGGGPGNGGGGNVGGTGGSGQNGYVLIEYFAS